MKYQFYELDKARRCHDRPRHIFGHNLPAARATVDNCLTL